MTSRATRAGGALASLSALLALGCPVDERPLTPLTITWIDNLGGQGGDGEAGNPNPFDAGMHGGGSSDGARAGGGGRGGASGSGALGGRSGGSGAGSAGRAGFAGSEAGTPGQVEPGCEDLDSDDIPDCQETLVKNGSFDANDEHWIADGEVEQSWAEPDADAQLESGSLTVTNRISEATLGNVMRGTQQCVNIDETGSYHFVSQVFVPDSQGVGNAGVNLVYYNLPGCQGSSTAFSTLEGRTGAWQLLYLNPATPMASRSVAVRLVAAKPYSTAPFQVAFDNILFVRD